MRRSMSPFEQARRNGARAAQKEHERLNTPMDRPVDIFEIIEKAGVWLMFQPMRDVFGSYQRQGDAAGIIINSNHPPSLQRFTAAHEYGHHVLGHEASIDDQGNINSFGSRLALQEVAAQSFAADFLMPLQHVNGVLRKLGIGIRPKQLTSSDVYRISLEVGASYAATVTQLERLGKINRSSSQRLRKERPLHIKEALAGGPPHQSRADVWILGQDETGRELQVRVEDEIHVFLEATPSGGYLWILEQPPVADDGSGGVELLRDVLEQAADENLYGARGLQHLVFRVAEPGSHSVVLAKKRPWQQNVDPIDEFVAHVLSAQRPTGEFDRGLAEEQKLHLLAG
jgi:Zn-dependent peptidase ImmA (M78 family)/predicted secreted protein